MRTAITGAAITLVLGVLWLAGELHRENCIRQKKADCSVLPWKQGKNLSQLDRFLREQR